MESGQVSCDTKQKSNGEHYIFSTIRGPYTGTPFSVFGFDAWVMKKKKSDRRSPHWCMWVYKSGPKLHDRIKIMGYYWPTMVRDCIHFSRRLDACQLHANVIHQPLEPLHLTIASWPFEA